MNVLVVRKTTNYEQHGKTVEARAKAGKVSPEVFERLKAAHLEHYRALESLRSSLNEHQINFVELTRDDQFPGEEFDYVITIGGDGTLLTTSHRIRGGVKVVGIRSSSSSVGYLCAVDHAQIDTFLDQLLNGSISFRSIPRVVARIIWSDDRPDTVTVPVLNDFLFTNVNPAATTRYKIHFNGQNEVQRSSGIWISTGTGSTAGIYAAGGEKVSALDKRGQFKVRELFTLGLSPATIEHGFFEPGDQTFRIENRCESAILAIDGQHGAIEVTYGDMIQFEKAPDIEIAASE